MLSSIFVIIIVIMIMKSSFPTLVKNKQYKELLLASFFLFIGTLMCMLYSLKMINFDATEWLNTMFSPISQMITSLYKT